MRGAQHRNGCVYGAARVLRPALGRVAAGAAEAAARGHLPLPLLSTVRPLLFLVNVHLLFV